MLAHLRSMTFYTSTPLGETLHYLSGYRTLEQEGLEGLMSLLRAEVRRLRASLLVIDGAVLVGQSAPSVQEWKRFLHALYVSTEFLGCTTLLVLPPDRSGLGQQAHTMVDGVIELVSGGLDMRQVRQLQVLKFRGSSFLEGWHHYTITQAGLVISPRTEASLTLSPPALAEPLSTAERPRRMGIGIAQLDAMLAGGLPAASTTFLLGTAGTGKTLLGYHFLAQGAAQGQKGVYFGFSQTPAQVLRTMAHLGLDGQHFVQEGSLQLLWHSPVQDLLDVLAQRLLEAVQRTGVQRLFLDGLSGFQQTVATPQRLDLFLTALFTTLRTLKITTMCAVELPELFSPSIELPSSIRRTTALADNILLLRHVELSSHLYRLISIMKMRDSSYDPVMREFRISEQGIEVAATFASAQAILTGVAHPMGVPQTPFATAKGESASAGGQER
jgi:circadian clock protein KaiC